MHIVHRLATIAVLAGVLGLVVSQSSERPAAAEESEGTLRGRALGSRGPVADAEVAVGIMGWAPAAGDHIATTRTDAEGRFTLADAPLGPIDVWARQPDGDWSHVIRMWNPGVNDLTVDVRGSGGGMPSGFSGFGKRGGDETLTGIVKDKQGKPIEGAAVGVRGDDKTYVVTDASGAFTVKNTGDGEGLTVRANGFKDVVTEVKLGKKRKMTIKMTPAKATFVHVTDPDGNPVDGAWVVLGDFDRVLGTTGFSAMFPPRARLVGGWTNAEGDASVVWGHSDGKTVATAFALGFAPGSRKISAGKKITLQLRAMTPARATVVMRDSDRTLPDVLVGLPHRSDGGADAISALPADQQRGPVIVGRSGPDGTCAIPHLDPDVKELRIVGDFKLRAKVRITRTDDAK